MNNKEDQDLQSRLIDRAMQMSDPELEALRKVAQSPVSSEWSRLLATWLNDFVASEQKRREFRTAKYPNDLVTNSWTPVQTAGALSLALMWNGCGISPMHEQFLRLVLQMMVGHATARLIEYEELAMGV